MIVGIMTIEDCGFKIADFLLRALCETFAWNLFFKVHVKGRRDAARKERGEKIIFCCLHTK